MLKCFKKRKLCSKCEEKTGNCVKCKLNAKLNNNSSHCECYPTFIYNITMDKCLSPCSYGQYFNQTLNKCKKCDDICKSCFGYSNKKCMKCIKNAILNDTTCACPKELYHNKKRQLCKRKHPLPSPKTACENDSIWDSDIGICSSIYLIKFRKT